MSHCSMRPSCMTPISSAMAKASCWSCVTRIAVAPLALRISRTSSDRRSRRSTSRFENGSSSSSSSGRGASARASATRCCWPPESSCGYWRSAPARPISAASSRTRGARRTPGASRRPKAMFSLTVKVREQRVVLEHHADVPALGRQHHPVARDAARRSAGCGRRAAARSRRCSAAPWSCRSRSARAGSRSRRARA